MTSDLVAGDRARTREGEFDRAWGPGAGFWEGVDAAELRFPRCITCGLFTWYPLPRCPHCRTETLQWTTVDPVGWIFSYTVLERAFLPAFQGRTPHTVVLARFDGAPGVTLVTSLADRMQGDRVEIGAKVRMTFSPDEAGIVMPRALLVD